MDLSSAPPTNMAASNTSAYGAPPQLGAPIPGMTGGMPAQSGLSVTKNPMAQELESRGRNGDTMLVHMTPDEVGGLQNLAMAMGGSLTINPETGLPEANFLKKLLPTLLGAGLSFIPGVGPLLAAGIVGGGQTLLTGDINKGLMAGLQAFGGASLGGAAGAGKVFGAKAAAGSALPGAATGAAPASGFSGALNVPGMPAMNVAASQFTPAMSISGLPGAASIAGQAASAAAPVAAKTGLAGFAQQFGQQASAGLGKGMLAKAAPYVAGASVLDAVNQATMPPMGMAEQPKPNYPTFGAPYQSMQRKVQPRESGPGGEIVFFDKVNPYRGMLTSDGRLPPGYAEGGSTNEEDPLAGLAALTQSFRTSPGAVTASPNYEGGSPSDRLRAQARAGETDYGFKKSSNTGIPVGGANTGAGGGGGGESTNANGATANVSSNDQMGGTSTANFVENTQHQINQRDGVYSPGPPGPYTLNPSLPGTNLDAVKVSGDGIMPDFKLEDLKINPVDMSNSDLRVSDTQPVGNLGLGGGYANEFGGPGGFGRELGFSGSGVYGSGLDSLNSMANFGSGLDSRIGGGNYNFLERDYSDLFAKGGEVDMDNGSFVVDARTVSELGNGSSNAGIEHLARMGGRPVRGGGDGVSDSVPARIGGRQEARVARDEVIFSPQAVAKVGGGNHKRGTQKLYAMMEKAHKARKQAKRGQDTKVAKGLGALS